MKLINQFTRGVVSVSLSRLASESLISVYGIRISVKYYQTTTIDCKDWRGKEAFKEDDFSFVDMTRLTPR